MNVRLRDVVKLFGLRSRKELSQNFIFDSNVTNRIARLALTGHAAPAERLVAVEVGPGPGGLTRSLLSRPEVQHVIVVEKDERFAPVLRMLQRQVGRERLTVVMGDMLTVDEQRLLEPWADAVRSPNGWHEPARAVLVGNLPFAVATELLVKWIRQLAKKEGVFHYGRVPMTLMFQREVGDRICAAPGSKQFGRLSVLAQHLCTTQSRAVFPPSIFVPPPDVHASLVTLEPLVVPHQPVPTAILEALTQRFFSHRRKMVGTVWSQKSEPQRMHANENDSHRGPLYPRTDESDFGTIVLSPEVLQKAARAAGIQSKLRPEQIPVRDWCNWAHQIK